MNIEILKIIGKEVGWIILGLLLTFLIAFIFLVILAGFKAVNLEPAPEAASVNSPVIFLSGLIAQNLAFLILAIKRSQLEEDRLAQWMEKARPISLSRKIGLGLVTGIILLAAFYLHQFMLYPFFSETQLAQSDWTQTQNWGFNEKIMLFIWGAVFAPIVEELYFREAMFGSIHRQGFPNFAMFFSCAVFGIIHLNFIFIFGYFIYGIGFAHLYRKTRSLLPPVIAHITINTIALWLILFGNW